MYLKIFACLSILSFPEFKKWFSELCLSVVCAVFTTPTCELISVKFDTWAYFNLISELFKFSITQN